MARIFTVLALLWATSIASLTASGADLVAAPEYDLRHVEPQPIPEGWITVPGPLVDVHGPPDRYAELLRLSRHAAVATQEFSKSLRVAVGDTIQVHLAPTDEVFRTLQPGNAPGWADATAYPSLGAIYLRGHGARMGTDEPIETVLEHELVHILLGRAFAPQQTPSWLQEGAAQVLAGQDGPKTVQTLARGMASGGLIDLEDLGRGFPSDPMRAQMAYAQTAHFVGWLTATYGEDVLPALVKEVRQGKPLPAAIRLTTGKSLSDVEDAWRDTLEGPIPFSVTALASADIWWAFGGVLLLVGGFNRRRTFLRRLDEMEKEEALVDDLLASMRRGDTPPPPSAERRRAQG
jgi:hypothetical protein